MPLLSNSKVDVTLLLSISTVVYGWVDDLLLRELEGDWSNSPLAEVVSG